MKKIISIVCAIALTASLAFAQENKEHNGQKGKNWFEKIRAEQAAFITQELDLSEAEAQAFWPVYNDVQKQRREAFHNQVVAMKALRDGGDDAEALLDKYLDAKKAMEKIDNESIARYKKVLPVEKVGKLIVAEESFRNKQIGKLGKGGQGQRPEGPMPTPRP